MLKGIIIIITEHELESDNLDYLIKPDSDSD